MAIQDAYSISSATCINVVTSFTHLNSYKGSGGESLAVGEGKLNPSPSCIALNLSASFQENKEQARAPQNKYV